ncbi:hypothetical protein NVP1148O_08 [Vibrio phage 1.148.O._10N.286.54.A10]|nr:hypothetical protein NVP1148O_08 [Vibrio phage 1.148.O._10N.286.54.A10]
MSIRNELLEKFLMATEAGLGTASIVKDIQRPYSLQSPPLNIDIDTGINPADYNGNTDISFAIVVNLNASGNNYAMYQSVDSSVLVTNPMIRFARTSEFEGVNGDANFAFWYDDTTESIHFECDVDGAGKTIPIASITTIKLNIQV